MVRSALLGVTVASLFVAAISLTYNDSKSVTAPGAATNTTQSDDSSSDPTQFDTLADRASNGRNQAGTDEGVRLADFVRLLARNYQRPINLDPGHHLGARRIPGLTIAATDLDVDMKKTLTASEKIVNAFLRTFHGTFTIRETDGVLEFVATDDLPPPADDPDPIVAITGTVKTSNGDAQSGTLVEIRNRHRTSFVTTDEAGRFQIKTIYNGNWELLISAKDETTGHIAGKLLPARYDEQLTSIAPIELVMKPAKALNVEVFDAAKSPVPKASVGVIVGDAGNYLLQNGFSDEQGLVRFSLPEDVRIYQLFAIAAGKGVDFNSYPIQVPVTDISDQFIPRPGPELARYGSSSLPQDSRVEYTESSTQPQDTVQLVLFGARKVVMKVQDEQGRPLPGIRFHPWYLEKTPGVQPSLNFSMGEQFGSEVTNDQGIVSFDWIPDTSSESQAFFHDSPDFISRYILHDAAASTKGPMVVTLEKPVRLSGRILDIDGQPATGATVTAVGDDFSGHDSHATATTDRDGKYTLKVFPRQVQMIVARSSDGKQMGSLDGIVIPPTAPVAGVDVQLCKTVRVFGSLTVEDGSKPARGVKIEIEQQGADLRRFKGVAFSRPMSHRENETTEWIGPDMKHSTTTDDDGRFEIRLCRGEYTFWPPSVATHSGSITSYEIDDDQDIEIEFDFNEDYWKQINNPNSKVSEEQR